MDPKALDRLVASEDAAGRPGPSPTKGAQKTWLLGEVGTYLVGRGAPPGTYKSATPTEGRTCRWRVLRMDGSPVRQGSSKVGSTVTIHKSDAIFETMGCSNWHRTS